jgi:glutamate--cysteine ligase
MTSSKQPAWGVNVNSIVNYYLSGIKSVESEPAVGIELEHTLLYKDGRPVSYNDAHGQKWLLQKLNTKQFPDQIVDPKTDALIGLLGQNASVTLEPAAQLELSAGPFRSLEDALNVFNKFEDRVTRRVSRYDIELLTPGYHPTRRAIDLELIPKRRYDFMNEYLGAISMYGICMMRGSASTQVSIDYYSERDCLRKMRIANALTPVLALICDNTPVFEGEPRTHKMMRTEIWKHCDPDRCNTVPGCMSRTFTLRDLAAYILNAPSLIDISSGEPRLSERTFGEIYKDKIMTRADVDHALSMFFNDVRLKTYIEIRPADAMPVEYAVAYAALIKGLFYDEGNLRALEDMFSDVREPDIDAAKEALMSDGYDGEIYGHPVTEYADEIVALASSMLAKEERRLLKPLAKLVSHRTTLADIAEGAQI